MTTPTPTTAAPWAPLAGKVAIVTGGAQGLGAAHVRVLAAQGAKVVLADIAADAGRETARSLAASGLDVVFEHLDVASAPSWTGVVDATVARWGGVDILVNNAATLSMDGVEEETDLGWDRIVDVNQRGVWYGMRAVIPVMKSAGGGSIVNIGSISGVVAAEGRVAYQATKGAVRMLTKNVAVSYAKDNIRANCIHPGIMDTGLAEDAGDDSDDEFIRMTPLGRLGRPEEVSYAVAFLASDQAGFITGAELAVDGGFSVQ